MAGYKKPTTIYRLKFEDRDGLEVRAASVPIGKLMDLQDQAGRLKAGDAKTFDEARELFATFAQSLRTWNLEEDDGTPVPTNLEGVMGLEFGFAAEILLAWFEAIASVAGPLGRKLTVGSPLAEASIPMETL